MSRKNKRASPPAFATTKGGHEHFTPMYDSLLDSPAYIALNSVAKVIYLILRQEYKGDYTGNNIICPYDTITAKGISRNCISPNLKQLDALGLINYESGGLGRKPNKFRFSEEWKKIKTLDEAKGIKNNLAEEKAEMKRRKELAKETMGNE